ncbi:MAG TPA: hypothetical protein VKY22_17580 [Bradyrhizobium sp.]|nr:hypothetical protein [Bradyrhizobium sp.]
MSEMPYRIDLDSVRKAFPLWLEAPSLLVDFAAWLEGRAWGGVGCFDLVGQFSDNAPLFDASLLRNEFALFMRLPDGSAAGIWYPNAGNAELAPVVLIDSEGQNEILAPSLEGLLAKIALSQFEDSDLHPDEDADDETDQLAAWLCKRLAVKDLGATLRAPEPLPDFAAAMKKWCGDREAYWSDHPAMKALSAPLLSHRPTAKNPWDRTQFEVAMVGAQTQIRVLRRGRQPVEEAAMIEPILRDLRDDMWREMPNLGLWYSMAFGLYADGRIMPRFDYDTRPMIDGKPADLAQARADLRRAPRPARWVPAWLDA